MKYVENMVLSKDKMPLVASYNSFFKGTDVIMNCLLQ